MASRFKALIVDDSEMSRLMIKMSIGPMFDTTEAEDGLVAFKKVQEAAAAGTPFDIIFMDIIMPEMDGKESVKHIREFEANRGLQPTPVYMVSASEMLGDIEGLVSGLLRKPPSKTLLNEIFEKHFGAEL